MWKVYKIPIKDHQVVNSRAADENSVLEFFALEIFKILCNRKRTKEYKLKE